jgi:hypothetical protein
VKAFNTFKVKEDQIKPKRFSFVKYSAADAKQSQGIRCWLYVIVSTRLLAKCDSSRRKDVIYLAAMLLKLSMPNLLPNLLPS